MEITAEQLQALKDYAAQNGKNWRAKLGTEWMGTADLGPNLRQLRNSPNFGPSGLVRFRLPEEEESISNAVPDVFGIRYKGEERIFNRRDVASLHHTLFDGRIICVRKMPVDHSRPWSFHVIENRACVIHKPGYASHRAAAKAALKFAKI